jgi:hypothetical protein
LPIHSPLDAAGQRRHPAGSTADTNPAANCVSFIAAMHNAKSGNFISFEQFQITLPREQITIILAADWHRTGGCHPIPKSELPP